MNNKTFNYYPVIRRGNPNSPEMEFRFPAYDKYDPGNTTDEWNLCELKKYLGLDEVIKNLFNLEINNLPLKSLMIDRITNEINTHCIHILSLLSSLCCNSSFENGFNLMKPMIKSLFETYIIKLESEYSSEIIDMIGFNNLIADLA